MRARRLVARAAFRTSTKGFGNMTGKTAVGHLLKRIASACFKTGSREEVCFADLCYKPNGADSWSRVSETSEQKQKTELLPKHLFHQRYRVIYSVAVFCRVPSNPTPADARVRGNTQ